MVDDGPSPYQRTLKGILEREEQEESTRRAVEDALRNDRLMHGQRP
jgi:hypothetical protein